MTIEAVSASVRGHQGASLAARDTVAATAKHYLADGATQGGVEGGDSVMSDQTMRNVYLLHTLWRSRKESPPSWWGSIPTMA